MSAREIARAVQQSGIEEGRRDRGMQSEYLYATYQGQGSTPGLHDIDILGVTHTNVPSLENAFATGLPIADFLETTTTQDFQTTLGTESPTNPPCEVTFQVGSTLTVMVYAYVRADADAAGEEFASVIELRETDGSGTIIIGSTLTNEGEGIRWYFDPALPQFTNFHAAFPITVPSPGQYWMQMKHDSRGTTIDIASQRLTVVPTSGPPAVGTPVMCVRSRITPLTIIGVCHGATI